MQDMVLVAIGGALGSVARWVVSIAVARTMGSMFPWGTILINVAGSAVIGGVAALTMPQGRFPDASGARLFVMTGLCGGFTTFSAFSLQTADLLREGRVADAGLNVGLSVVACVLATAGAFAGVSALASRL